MGWEYRREEYQASPGDPETVEALNELGAEGWEAYAPIMALKPCLTNIRQQPTAVWIVFLKRAVTKEQ